MGSPPEDLYQRAGNTALPRTMKILSVVGARPQFIKCAPLSREIRKDHEEVLVHTGQHYDPEMSDIFFRELRIPPPDHNLGVGSGPHGWQTGEILARLERVIQQEEPKMVLIYGDTNSTLAGALAAAKLGVMVGHVEAGLRSFDRSMPEEINRVVADHLSDYLFCPTETAVVNLSREGICRGVSLPGDVMVDALLFNRDRAMESSQILDRIPLQGRRYLVATVHRPANTDSCRNMEGILGALGEAGIPVVFPVHPRTRKYLEEFGLWDRLPPNLVVTVPLGYLDMLRLMAGAEKILTDSGGIQKEAYILGVPCITLRENTEWIETVEAGWNVLAGADPARIREALGRDRPVQERADLFGPPGAARRIAGILGGL